MLNLFYGETGNGNCFFVYDQVKEMGLMVEYNLSVYEAIKLLVNFLNEDEISSYSINDPNDPENWETWEEMKKGMIEELEFIEQRRKPS